MRNLMINISLKNKYLIGAAVFSIVILWSEFHASLNKHLGLNDIKGDTYFVFLFIAAVALVSIVATLISIFLTRNSAGSVKKIIRLNLIIFSIAIFPTIGWFLFEYAPVIVGYIVYGSIVFWPVLLIVLSIANMIAVASIKGGKAIKQENTSPTVHHDSNQNIEYPA